MSPHVAKDGSSRISPHEAGFEAVANHVGAIPVIPRNGLRLLDLRQPDRCLNPQESKEIDRIAQAYDVPVEVRQDTLYHAAGLELYIGRKVDSVWRGDYIIHGIQNAPLSSVERPLIDRLKRRGQVMYLKGRYAYIQMPGIFNYFHWTVETFPRLQLISSMIEDGQLDGIVPLHSRNIPPFIYQSILLDYPRLANRIIYGPDEIVVLCDDLYFFAPGSVEITKGSVTIQRRITTSTKAMIDRIPRMSTPGQHVVFVSRHKKRELVNEADLIDYLRRHYAVDVVAGHTLSVKEQRERFGTASVIIGAHGAGLTNAIYAPRGCKLIEISFSDILYRTHCYYDICTLARGTPYVILGEKIDTTAAIQRGKPGASNIYLSPKRFEAIRDLIA